MKTIIALVTICTLALLSTPAKADPVVAPAVPVASSAPAPAATPGAPGEAAAPVATDPATPTAHAESAPMEVAGEVIKAARTGNWRMVAALMLALLMTALGKVRGKIKWFKGDRGGAVLVMLLSLGGALSTALATSAKLDWHLFAGAVGIAFTAVGGYSWISRLIWPVKEAQAPAANG